MKFAYLGGGSPWSNLGKKGMFYSYGVTQGGPNLRSTEAFLWQIYHCSAFIGL